jgi:general secretion pathway protein G
VNQSLLRFLHRRRFLINADLQVKLLKRAMIGSFAIFAVIATALVLPLVAELQAISPDSHGQVGAAELLLFLNDRLLVIAVLTPLAIALASVRSSHQIAGPLLQIKRALRRIREGEGLIGVRTREGDLLLDEVDEVNLALAHLRAASSALRREHSELNVAIESLRQEMGECDAVARLEERAQSMAEALDRLGGAPAGESVAWMDPETGELWGGARRPTDATPTPMTSSRERGFTIIELMVVVVVIAIIVALVVPRYRAAVQNARIVKATATIRGISSELMVQLTRHGELPKELDKEWVDPWGNPYEYVNFELLGTDEARLRRPFRSDSETVEMRALPAGSSEHRTLAKKKRKRPNSAGGAEGGEELVPLNSDYDLFSRGPDGITSDVLEDPASRDDVIRADNGSFIGRAAQFKY